MEKYLHNKIKKEKYIPFYKHQPTEKKQAHADINHVTPRTIGGAVFWIYDQIVNYCLFIIIINDIEVIYFLIFSGNIWFYSSYGIFFIHDKNGISSVYSKLPV